MHTPGPWEAVYDVDDREDERYLSAIAARSGKPVMVGLDGVYVSNNDLALMLAAPDLYAALNACAGFLENVTDDDPNRNDKFFRCRELWRNAFTKARGGV